MKYFMLLLTVALMIAACKSSEGPAERAGKSVDRHVEDAADAVEDAAEDVEDAARGHKDRP